MLGPADSSSTVSLLNIRGFPRGTVCCQLIPVVKAPKVHGSSRRLLPLRLQCEILIY